MSEDKLKNVIKEYLSNTELKETLHDDKLELGFRFLFPKGKNPDGKPLGRPFTVVKEMKKDILEISSNVSISKQHVDAFDSMEKGAKQKFFKNLAKVFHLKEVFFNIDLQNNRYAIIDNIFLNKGEIIVKNTFYNSIRKVLGCIIYSIIELQDFCSGEFDAGSLKIVP